MQSINEDKIWSASRKNYVKYNWPSASYRNMMSATNYNIFAVEWLIEGE